MLVKETIAGRKNTSPQNLYETTQLYAVGALKIACVGLQCVGFNNPMYRTILDQAEKCARDGSWSSGVGFSGGWSGGGLGTGAAWNINAMDRGNTEGGP